jgi:hypothetical protein
MKKELLDERDTDSKKDSGTRLAQRIERQIWLGGKY